MRTRRILVVLGCTAGLVLAGCGDDDDGDGANGGNGGNGGDLEAFCDFNAELEEQEGSPSDEQLDRIVELAPGEVRDAVETVADAHRGDPDAEDFDEAFDDPEYTAADDEFEEFVQENCED